MRFVSVLFLLLLIAPPLIATETRDAAAQIADKLEMKEGARWYDRYNLLHRFRVMTREHGEKNKNIDSVPYPVFVANTAGAMIAIHFSETFVLGPLMIYAGSHLPGPLGAALVGYGGLLTWPVPTGTPIDLITESGCLLVGALVALAPVQKGLYRIEKKIASCFAPTARALRLDKALEIVLRGPSIREKIESALKDHPDRFERLESGDLNFNILYGDTVLSELEIEDIQHGKKLRLSRFSLFPSSRSPSGRKALASSLRLLGLGWNARDAVLKPQMLLRGGHGQQEPSAGKLTYRINNTAVTLQTCADAVLGQTPEQP